MSKYLPGLDPTLPELVPQSEVTAAEKMQKAILNFRKMIPLFESFAEASFGKRIPVRVPINGDKFYGQAAYNDGKAIFIIPPLELADEIEHDRNWCGVNDDDGVAYCAACAQFESVFASVCHEIAHFTGGSRYGDYRDENRHIIALAMSPSFGAALFNVLEDIRVEQLMFRAQVGTKSMRKGVVNKILKQINAEESERPLNSLAAISLIASATDVNCSDYLPAVRAFIEDPEIQKVIEAAKNASSADEALRLIEPLRDAAKKYKIFCEPEDLETSEESDDDDSQSGDAPGENESGEDSRNGESSEDSRNESSGSEDSEEKEEESEGDRSSEDSNSEDNGGSGDRSDSPDESEQSASGTDADGNPDEDGKSESESRNDDSPSDEDEINSENSESDSGNSERESSDEDYHDEETSEKSSEGDDSDSTADGESSDSSEGDECDDSGDESESTPESSSSYKSGEGEESSESDSSSGDSSGSGNEESNEGGTSGNSGDDSDLNNVESDANQIGASGDSEPADSGSGADASGASASGARADSEPASNGSEPADSVGEPSGSGTASDADLGEADLNNLGNSDDVENVIGILTGHSDHDEWDNPLNVDQIKAIATSIETFGEDAGKVTDLIEFSFIPNANAWECFENGQPSTKNILNNIPYRSSQSNPPGRRVWWENGGILEASLSKMRVAFSENDRSRSELHRKSGKVNARALGKRAPIGDDRLFKKKTFPKKRDYAVLIMVDISGSTSTNNGENLNLEMNAVIAQAELLSRLGVKFSIVGHSGAGWGNGYAFLKAVLKDWDDPWSSKQVLAAKNMFSAAANLDGHAMTYARQAIIQRRETDRIIMYYSDGKMPLENYEEELRLLKKELKLLKSAGIVVAGVGVNTDSPSRHGLPTVEIREEKHLPLVVNHLEKLIADK